MENKNILITGGTGSWGNELVTQLLKVSPKEIKILSRNEFNQVTMKRRFNNPKLKFIIGDVRDYDVVKDATTDVNIIFHLAALKHVPIAEEQPLEAIKTNILGTTNIIKAAKENNVTSVIDISSDKACSPINLYGMTKAIGEKLTISASLSNTNTRFSVIRGGNALGSAGSVLQFFIDQIKQNNKVPITDLQMTRFFITLSDAIELVLRSTATEISGGILVMKMPACKIIDLAEVLIEEYGNKKTTVEEIGIRQGEKIHEVLISKDEALWTYVFDNKYFLYHPYKKLDLPKIDFKEYSSNQELMTKKEIKDLLKRGGFIE